MDALTQFTVGFLAIPSVNKHLVMQLVCCEYVARRENVIAIGNNGTGKTHVALGLGLADCQRGLPKESLASLGVIEADSATLNGDGNGDGRIRRPPALPRRKPTPRQRVPWKAVQQAKLRELSIRATARELGIHRNTVRKYAEAKSPPMMCTRVGPRVAQPDRMTVA